MKCESDLNGKDVSDLSSVSVHVVLYLSLVRQSKDERQTCLFALNC